MRTEKLRKWVASLCAILCLVTGTASFSVPTQAQTFVQAGDTLYTLPDFTTQQKKDLAQDMDLLDKALFQHKTTVTMPLAQADQLCRQEKQAEGMLFYVLFGAMSKHHTTLQHGYYMGAYLRGCDLKRVTPSSWTWTLNYHDSFRQEQQVWQYAQQLVKQEKISTNPEVGIKQIYQYLIQNVSYDDDAANASATFSGDMPPKLPQITAYGAWFCPQNGKHKTTCGGYAQMFYLMCRAMGWNHVYVVTDYHAHHAFNAVQEKDGMHYFDACLGASHNAQKYFDMSEYNLLEHGVKTKDLHW